MALARQFVVGLRLLRFHHRHVGGTLAPHLFHEESLSEQQLRLLLFFLSHLDQSFAVGHLHIRLQHGDGRLVLLAAQSLTTHQYAGFRCLQRMQTAEAIEYGQGGLQGIDIIEGADIGIRIGLRVDGSPEVILYRNHRIDIRKESPDGGYSRRLVVVEVESRLTNSVVMFHGILHTLLHAPRLLGSCLLHVNDQGDECGQCLYTVHILLPSEPDWQRQSYAFFRCWTRAGAQSSSDCLIFRHSDV